MTGGDSLTEDLNIYYNAGDIAWMIASTALVLLMIPGVGFFYSGLARRKSALSLIWLSIMATAVTTFQWFFWGYSLAFSHKAGLFIGALDNFGFMDDGRMRIIEHGRDTRSFRPLSVPPSARPRVVAFGALGVSKGTTLLRALLEIEGARAAISRAFCTPVTRASRSRSSVR